MNAKRLRGALFSRAGKYCFIASIIIFVCGLWLALTVDYGPFCVFLCVMPLSLVLVYIGTILEDADLRRSALVPIRDDGSTEQQNRFQREDHL